MILRIMGSFRFGLWERELFHSLLGVIPAQAHECLGEIKR